jgi:hypothetical protein
LRQEAWHNGGDLRRLGRNASMPRSISPTRARSCSAAEIIRPSFGGGARLARCLIRAPFSRVRHLDSETVIRGSPAWSCGRKLLGEVLRRQSKVFSDRATRRDSPRHRGGRAVLNLAPSQPYRPPWDLGRSTSTACAAASVISVSLTACAWPLTLVAGSHIIGCDKYRHRYFT